MAIENLVIPANYPSELFTKTIYIYKSLINFATNLDQVSEYLTQAQQAINSIIHNLDLEKAAQKRCKMNTRKQ